MCIPSTVLLQSTESIVDRNPSKTGALELEVEIRPEEYDVRLTPKWASHFLEEADKRSKLHRATYSFVAELRAICMSASLPFTLVKHVVRFYDGYVRGSKDRDLPKAVRLTASRLVRALEEADGEDTLTAGQRKLLGSEVLRVEGQLKTAEDADYSEQLGDAMWDRYLEDKGFQLGAWGSQRLAYVGVYNAYDSFVTAGLKSISGQQRVDRNKERAIAEYFGERAIEKCWRHHDLQVGRLVRHAISHAEGRETQQLLACGHNIRTTGSDRVLSVFPEDIRCLLRRVESASKFLVTCVDPDGAAQ